MVLNLPHTPIVLEVVTVADAGRSVWLPTTPVRRGARLEIIPGGESKAVYTVPGVEATTMTPRAYRVPEIKV